MQENFDSRLALVSFQISLKCDFLFAVCRYEVPRMLYAAQQVEELQDYIDNSSDPELQRWWAHFCEANDLLAEAVEYYIAVR